MKDTIEKKSVFRVSAVYNERYKCKLLFVLSLLEVKLNIEIESEVNILLVIAKITTPM